MDEPKPKRPWLRKKRWWAVGLLWLVLAYPVSIGPAAYLAVRGVVSYETYNTIYRPMDRWFFGTRWSELCYAEEYITWWVRLAERHSGNKL